MSRTLFWYIFKDLLRIFLLTSAALAGMMSFGGLLRPLTEQGLNVSQVSKILTYFMPAMTAYSLPIAALFATTITYGRLASDNELVACRAAGVSHLALTFPAFVFGSIIAGLSLLLLCFIVPVFMLKVERVIFSNVAQIVASTIERSHQLRLLDTGREPVTIFAQGATVLPPDPSRPNEQSVALMSPTIMTYEPLPRGPRSEIAPRIPRDFYTARQATAFITQDSQTDELTVTTELMDGIKFPRKFEGGLAGGVQSTHFTGKFPSQIRENTKFMTIMDLRRVLEDSGRSKRVRKTLAEFIVAEQIDVFLRDVLRQLAEPASECWLDSVDRDQFIIRRGAAVGEIDGRVLLVGSSAAGQRPIEVRQLRNGTPLRSLAAAQLRVTALPDQERKLLNVTIESYDVIVTDGDRQSPRERFYQQFAIAMPEQIAAIPGARTPADYLDKSRNILPEQQRKLARDRLLVTNSVISELHSRVSFAISCLILVMVGSALGMMLRSGNFLSAFAVSVVPALICISLIVTGQHTAENVPWDLSQYKGNINTGIAMVWAGNVLVGAVAVALLGRLQRQ